jgi:uncharacterized protein
MADTRRNGTRNSTPGVTADQVFTDLVLAWRGMAANDNPAWLAGGRVTAVRGSSGAMDDNSRRDLDRECGYPAEPSPEQYQAMYERVGVGRRVVRIWPDECWAAYPELYESDDPGTKTEFEVAWAELEKKVQPWHFLHRADTLSRIGRYGVLLLGLSDGADLAEPVRGVNRDGTPRANRAKLELLYLRAFPESQAEVTLLEGDVKSPRYGQPLSYRLTLANPGDPLGGRATVPQDVHWTRIIHLAEYRESSEVFATPALRPVYNNILDIRKVSGSAAEMFYKGGFPGYSFETYPDLAGQAPVNKAAVRAEVSAYTEGLQRFLTAVGGSWKSLAPQVADPSKNLQQQLTLICATIGVPVRIFLGSESGHLASTQDAGTWKERLQGRQTLYLEPMVVRPLVDRLVGLGVLPPPKGYKINWRDLRTLGEKDRADVALKQVQALMQYMQGGVSTILPLRHLLTLVMGLTDSQVEAIIKKVGEDPKPPPPPTPAPGPQGGGRSGKAPRRNTGRPPGRVEGKP